MNIARGLFRAWVFVSVLWCAGILTLGFGIEKDQLHRERYQYVPQLRAGVTSEDLKAKPMNEITFLLSAASRQSASRRLAYAGVDTSDRRPRWWPGQAARFAPLSSASLIIVVTLQPRLPVRIIGPKTVEGGADADYRSR
jgi:hypothetical protein